MNTIINKNTKSFKEFEKNIFDIICLIGESLTSYILEKWDDEINENRDKKKYRNKGLRKTSIKTIYGEVTYRRRVYETEDGDQRTVNKRRRSVPMLISVLAQQISTRHMKCLNLSLVIVSQDG